MSPRQDIAVPIDIAAGQTFGCARRRNAHAASGKPNSLTQVVSDQ